MRRTILGVVVVVVGILLAVGIGLQAESPPQEEMAAEIAPSSDPAVTDTATSAGDEVELSGVCPRTPVPEDLHAAEQSQADAEVAGKKGGPERSAEFYRNLKGAEREVFLRDHKGEYMQAHRDGIIRALQELETATGTLERNSRASYLAKRSICLLMDVQNRAEMMPDGEPVSMKSMGDEYCFFSNNWVYRFSGSEFPEWAYMCEIRRKSPKGPLGPETYPPLPAHIIQLLHYRAAAALAAFPESP